MCSLMLILRVFYFISSNEKPWKHFFKDWPFYKWFDLHLKKTGCSVHNYCTKMLVKHPAGDEFDMKGAYYRTLTYGAYFSSFIRDSHYRVN